MTLRSKLNAGFSFLFLVLLITGGLGLFSVLELTRISGTIIKDNYRSVDYMVNLQQVLASLSRDLSRSDGDPLPVNRFRQTDSLILAGIRQEMTNCTEPGERELAARLLTGYQNLTGMVKPADGVIRVSSGFYLTLIRPAELTLQTTLSRITRLNLDAIVKKNETARKSASQLVWTVVLFLTLFIPVSLVFVLKFPGYIARPVTRLTRGLIAISERKYTTRLEFPKGSDLTGAGEAFNLMAERLQELESGNIARLLAEKSRIEAVINQFTDPLAGLDESGRIIFINQAACKLSGLSEPDILGKTAAELGTANDTLQVLFSGLDQDKPGAAPGHPEFTFRIDGKDQFFSREVREVTSGNTPPVPAGVVILLRNITVFHELNMAKTNLIATVSHEMKTPLASINLTLKLLKDHRTGDLTSDQVQLLDSIRQDSQRLSKIVRELLDLAQVETGHIRLRPTRVNPDDLILYAVSSLMVQIESKEIELEVSIPDHLPAFRADLEKTLWVMINILTNAIRFTPEKGKIGVSASSSGREVLFAIRDSGPGIDPAVIEKIFDKFVRINPGSSVQKESTGLGLAIAREFILAQGGKIWADSDPGKGSAFFFSFPAED